MITELLSGAVLQWACLYVWKLPERISPRSESYTEVIFFAKKREGVAGGYLHVEWITAKMNQQLLL